MKYNNQSKLKNDLNVFLFEKKIGIFTRKNDYNPFQVSFTYLPEYTGLPISISMPVQKDSYEDKLPYSFFQNLLPEGEILLFIAKQKRFSSEDIFSALQTLGKETAGALIITEDQDCPLNDNLYIDKTEDILNFLRNNDSYLSLNIQSRLSLAGAQDKLPIFLDKDRFFLPVNYAPTTHILKPDNIHFPGIVYNESFCLNLAKNLDLPAVDNTIFEKEGCRPILCLKRYDRENGLRLHQEDFCQAMGLSRSKKYQSDGFFNGIKDIIEISDDLNLELNTSILDFMLLSYFIGNMDGHIKNLSLLYHRDGSISLAPFYDLVCTEIYPNLSKEMSIAFGMHFLKDEIDESDFYALASDLCLDFSIVFDRLQYFIENLPKAVDKTRELYGDNPVIEKISNVISRSIELIEYKLSCVVGHE